MHFIADIGNTSVKAAVMEDGTVVRAARCNLERGSLDNLLADCQVSSGIWCSTRPLSDAEQNVMGSLAFPMLHFTPLTKTPLVNRYASPATLGADRLAAAVGAWAACPGENLLVIDAGTAITYDYVSAAGEYLGGNISPGKDMRFAALHEHTGSLPLVRAEGNVPETGYDTESAIRSGVLLGMRREIEGYICQAKESGLASFVFLTGGDAQLFENTIKSGNFARKYLVLEGLDCICRYNEQV